jgi:hypothetical protein
MRAPAEYDLEVNGDAEPYELRISSNRPLNATDAACDEVRRDTIRASAPAQPGRSRARASPQG